MIYLQFTRGLLLYQPLITNTFVEHAYAKYID